MRKSIDKDIEKLYEPINKTDKSKVPILHSFIVLRQEYFGGFVFNPFLPPETRLDHIRFKIAALCNGKNNIGEIGNILENDLEHSKEYIETLVRDTINSLNKNCAIYWRNNKLEKVNNIAYFKKDRSISQQSRVYSAPLFVIWEVTGACNLRCKHCLSDSGRSKQNELNTSEAKRLIDTLEMMKIFNINFSGGEPLIRPDIFELLEYASEKKMGIELLSNGALITPEVIKKLENTNIFSVQISIDGLKNTHDAFRGIKGSFKRSINAIKLLKNANYGLSISSAVTRQNIDEIPEIIDSAIDLGANSYKTTLFMPTGRGKNNVDDLILTPHDVKRFTFMLLEKKKEVGDKIIISNEELYPWLIGNPNKTCSKSQKREDNAKIGCTAGNSSLYITPDGKITPCPFLSKFVAGDIRKGNLKRIWNKSSTFEIFRNITKGDLKGKCGNCEHLSVSCYGGCRAAAYAHSADIYAEDPLCWKEIV
jgi:radical SAM protein with 4Fe4S-binding SPASM domain